MDNLQTKPYDSPAYKRSRSAYKMENTFEYFIAILVGDAFLAKLLTNIGFSESAVGIISSLVTLAFLFQLVSIFIVRKITNTKLVAILFHTLSQLFFVSLYLVPFMPFATEIKKPLTVVCILFAYFGNYMVSNLIEWTTSSSLFFRSNPRATRQIIYGMRISRRNPRQRCFPSRVQFGHILAAKQTRTTWL